MREVFYAGLFDHLLVVVIKRLAIVLLTLFVLAIIAVALGKFAGDTLLRRPPDAASKAISIAMNDPNVKREMAYNNVRAITESKPFSSTQAKGFLNHSGNLIAVHVALRSPSVPPPDYNFYFIIDMDTGLIVDKTSYFDVMAGDDEMTLPPRSAWYLNISRSVLPDENGKPSVHFSAGYTPASATVYQAITNGEGLEKLRNAPAGLPLQDVNISCDMLAINGTHPAGSGWNGSVTLPSVETQMPHSWPSTNYLPDRDYYLVFINGESDRLVNLTLRVPIFGSVYY